MYVNRVGVGRREQGSKCKGHAAYWNKEPKRCPTSSKAQHLPLANRCLPLGSAAGTHKRTGSLHLNPKMETVLFLGDSDWRIV